MEAHTAGPRKMSRTKGAKFLAEMPCNLFNSSNQCMRMKEIGLDRNIGKGANLVRPSL